MIYLHILGIITTIQSMIFIHELGHLIYFRYGLNRYAEIRFFWHNIKNWGVCVGHEIDYIDLEPMELIDLYMCGIVAGLIPIFVSAFFNPNYSFIILPYICACRSDIINIFNVSKNDKQI